MFANLFVYNDEILHFYRTLSSHLLHRCLHIIKWSTVTASLVTYDAPFLHLLLYFSSNSNNSCNYKSTNSSNTARVQRRQTAHINRGLRDFYRNCNWPPTRAYTLVCLFKLTNTHSYTTFKPQYKQKPVYIPLKPIQILSCNTYCP